MDLSQLLQIGSGAGQGYQTAAQGGNQQQRLGAGAPTQPQNPYQQMGSALGGLGVKAYKALKQPAPPQMGDTGNDMGNMPGGAPDGGVPPPNPVAARGACVMPMVQGGAVNPANPSNEAFAQAAAQKAVTPMAGGGTAGYQSYGGGMSNGFQSAPQQATQQTGNDGGQQQNQGYGYGGQHRGSSYGGVAGYGGGYGGYQQQRYSPMGQPQNQGYGGGGYDRQQQAPPPQGYNQPQAGGAGYGGGYGQSQAPSGYYGNQNPGAGMAVGGPQGPSQQQFMNSPMGRQQMQQGYRPMTSYGYYGQPPQGGGGDQQQQAPAPMAGGGVIDGGIAGLEPSTAESGMRRYSPIGPRNPQEMMTPKPEDMAHRLPRRMMLTPRINVKLPRPKIPGVGAVGMR